VTVRNDEAQPITDFSTVEQRVEVAQECIVQDIEVDVAIRHSYVGDLTLSLISPTGTTAVLSRRRGGARPNLERTFRASDTRALQPLIGQSGGGTWTLSVRDSVEVDTGTFESFELRLVCAAPGAQVVAPGSASGARHAATGAGSGQAHGGLRIPTVFGRNPAGTQPADVVDPWAN
jgi:subtilisin-like proprotein convertase family protein